MSAKVGPRRKTRSSRNSFRQGRGPGTPAGNGNGVRTKTENNKSLLEMLAKDLDRQNNLNELPVEEWRHVYKNEISTLWQEVEDFRRTCRKEMTRQQTLLDDHRRKCEEARQVGVVKTKAPDVTEDKDYAKEMKALKNNMHTLQEKQKLLDKEEELCEREEQLSKRQEKLKEYEKDIEEAEALLNKRQNIAKRRSQEIELLNHDLLLMKQDLAESVESAENQFEQAELNTSGETNEPSTSDNSSVLVNSPETSCKARRNWQLARRHLVDKVTLLETTVQRYRTQVATSSATTTAKDMIIARLQKEAADMRDLLEQKDKRIKKLESQLAISIEDKTRSERKLDMLLEELQNIDLSTLSREPSSPEKSPSKHDTTIKRKTLRKQQSMFSFLAHHGSHKREGSISPMVQRSKALGNKENIGKDQTTPKKKDLIQSRVENDILESTSEQNDNNNANAHTTNRTQDVEHFSDLQDDLGSKACVVM